MRLREYRRTLQDSLSTIVEIEPTIDALMSKIREALAPYCFSVYPESVHVGEYDIGKEWSHIVTIDDYGVFGFTDGPLE